METTIVKRITALAMENVFLYKSHIANVKHFRALDAKSDLIPSHTYNFEIVIRHPEGANAEKLFDTALNS